MQALLPIVVVLPKSTVTQGIRDTIAPRLIIVVPLHGRGKIFARAQDRQLHVDTSLSRQTASRNVAPQRRYLGR